MARARQPKQIRQMTFIEWETAFPNEEACCAYLVRHRWPDGVACPRCGNVNVKAHGTMLHNWLCNACSTSGTNYRFSHISGTIFENTNKPLRDWFRVIHMMMTSKKGISALQVMRVMGFGSYKTAHYMCHRIRAGLMDEEFRKLVGIVEVDETFIGGQAENRHYSKRGKGLGRGNNKAVVAGAVERKGNVVARVVANTKTETLRAFVKEAVSSKVSMICTDALPSYDKLKREYFHRSVNHHRGEYVVGAIHTQTIEGFWSLIKRGMVGTYHKVSAKYLPLYVAEFEFRYNNRGNADIFGAAVASC